MTSEAKEGAPRKKTTAIKSTQTAKGAYKVVKRAYERAREAAASGAPVAWVMVRAIQEELLRAWNVVPVYTENYGAVCAAKKGAQPFLESAEADGFSNLICGYARTGIGHARERMILGEIPAGAPEGGMADPDFLIGSSGVCDPRYKWYQALGRYMNVPYLAIDVLTPPSDADPAEYKDYYIKYTIKELKRFVAFLEKVTGVKYDPDRLMEVILLSEKTKRIWWECHNLRKAIPGPMPTQDMMSCVTPGLMDPGDPESFAFYQGLYNELKDRVERGIGVVPNEKYRIMMGGGLPPWHNMGIFNYFEDQGAVFVMESTYFPAPPCEEVEGCSDPLERLAVAEFHFQTYRYEKARKGCGIPRAQQVLDWVNEYHIDGIVMHGSISCRATTIGQIFFRRVIQEHAKIPILLIESDIVDERDYSETQTKSNIDAFIETLATAAEKEKEI